MQQSRVVRSIPVVFAAMWGTLAHSQTAGNCELCGKLHTAQAPVYVTDWETNVLHRYGALDCALEAMRTQFGWSRAAVSDNSTGERITITRAQGNWTVRPEEAVLVVRPAEDGSGCAAYDYYASRDEFVRYTKKHKQAARSGPPPERLADFVDAYVAQHGGTPSPALAAPSQSVGGASPAPAGTERPDPAWAQDAVGAVQAEGIMKGYPDGTFKGDGQVTRYEMAVIAQRLLQRMGQTSAPGENAAAASAPAGPSTQELVKALEDDLTAAGANRGEVAAALKVLNDAAAEGVTVPAAAPVDTDWPDVPDDHWASDAVRTVTNAGVMNGYPDNTFQGDKPLTRYEIAVIAARLLGIAAHAAPPEGAGPAAEAVPAPEGEKSEEPTAEATAPSGAEPGEAAAGSSAEAHLNGLKAQLMAQGVSDEEADRLLEPVRQAMEGPAAAPPTTTQPGPPPTVPSAGESEQQQGTAPPPAEGPTSAEALPTTPLLQEPNMLGVSGFLLTPSADISGNSDSIQVGLSRALGSNLLFGNTSAVDGLELTLLSTSGDLPSRIMIGGKKQVWRSSDGRSRAAVGVLDATDEIDSTIYAAYSKSLRSRFWTHTPHDWTLTVGLGAGDLLDGIFASAYSPLSDQLSVGAEIVDFGDSGMDLNYGLEYKLGRGWHLKAGIVDGDLSAEATVEKGL